MNVTPLTMDIDVRTDGEHEQHGEVAIVMTTEQADKLAELLDGVPSDSDQDGARFARLMVEAIRTARTATTTEQPGQVWQAVMTGRITALLPEGYIFDPNASTGGGCTAYEIRSPEGHTLKITDGDGDVPFTDSECPDVVFTYHENSERVGELILETHGDVPSDMFWEGFDVSVKAWISGDPYMEI
jgi:hypothetical protein